jgi:hypothetical protein
MNVNTYYTYYIYTSNINLLIPMLNLKKEVVRVFKAFTNRNSKKQWEKNSIEEWTYLVHS